ncbi:hypothetical protein G7068_01525 [Leucobacter viscericola]|uniref:OmdA domain containing protein n=1 Tax=Leucobacter viscericola TaxID=2714935 RepID=A0A6G7XC55_9MICO|nr:YdeI/OmpD-associated family protein [Leucobacter viscericola]QIK62029.1 hypothetical protein G7068_01525 [Leucobacter viscericola]
MANAALPTDNELVLLDVEAWRAWLDDNEDSSSGVWLRLAKKGTTSPTSLSYAEALDEALCSGWIDGQRRAHDESTFHQRFTPRRPRSIWSERNVGHIERLREQNRMRPRGEREIALAQQDGRWERAYAGSASATVPDDLKAALESDRAARDRFESLSSQERYSALHRLMTATNEATRARRLQRIMEQLQNPAGD